VNAKRDDALSRLNMALTEALPYFEGAKKREGFHPAQVKQITIAWDTETGAIACATDFPNDELIVKLLQNSIKVFSGETQRGAEFSVSIQEKDPS